MINWKKRLKNKAFIVSLISAGILAAQVVLKPFGVDVPSTYITDSVNAVLAILTIMGVVVDPTTSGLTDGE